MTRLTRRLAVLLVVQCVVCTGALCPGAAQEIDRKWTSYMRDRDTGTEYFYEKETLMNPSPDLIQMWRKRVFPAGASQKEIVTFEEIDCRAARYRSLELQVTYWDGTSKRFEKASPWGKIYANSPDEFLMDEHCK